MYTGASEFNFGASFRLENDATVLQDYWENDDCRPIHEKEAAIVLKSLQSLIMSGVSHDSRVEVLSDNMEVIGSWKN